MRKTKSSVIIGIDVGTTSVKVLAADQNGKEYKKAESTYSINQPEVGFREQNPDVLLKKTEKTILKVLSDLKQPVAGFCFSAAMHSIIAIDKNGNPVTEAIIWADVRSTSLAKKLRESRGEEIYKFTGAPIHAMLPLCKIAWLRDNQPDIFTQAYKFISIKEYFVYRWFKEFFIDYSMASATGMFNIEKLNWMPQALDFAGITEERLSKPVPTTFILKCSNELAQKFNIPVDTPFVMGASDGCLANLNASGLNSKEATLTLGTSGAIRITVQKFKHDPQMRVFNYILTEKYRIIGGPTNNGGIILDWLLEKFYPDLSNPVEVLVKAAKISPGAEGLICVPYFYGERAPEWDENMAGIFFGVQSHHSRDHFARAALEGIIFNLVSIAQGVQAASGRSPEAIWADGGLTRSEFIVQMISDIFNLPVYLVESSHGADRGAILLGAYALGLNNSLERTSQNPKRITFQPNKERYQIYQANYNFFEKARKAPFS